jgi:hypothetical protein
MNSRLQSYFRTRSKETLSVILTDPNVWIMVLLIAKVLLLLLIASTIGSEQTVALALVLDLVYLILGILFSRTLCLTYCFTNLLCMSLYLSYYFETGANFTSGADDEIYYDNFRTVIGAASFSDGYETLMRRDLTTLIIALASAPFRLIGIEFKSPIDFFLLQASLLAPLGPLIQKLSMKLAGEKISFLYFIAFTPYWYAGVVGREWPLYYLALLLTLFLSVKGRTIFQFFPLLFFLYPASLVRFEAIFIFGIFLLFHFRLKIAFIVTSIIAVTLIQFFSDYYLDLLQFATEKSRAIYFSQEEQSAGLGGALKYSENIFFKPIFILYLTLSPIPPYFFVHQTFENFILLPGHLLWPLLILSIVFRLRKFISILKGSAGIRAALIGFITIILLMAFYGGTHRHYYPFIPHLLLILPMMLSAPRFLGSAFKLPLVALVLAGVSYISVSVLL